MDQQRTAGAGRLRPPGLGLLLAEAQGIFEFNTSLLLSPLLMRAPRGDGHPVLTLPGFLASDLSMAPMRRYLRELGYDTYAWKMGRNIGGVSRMRGALRDRLAEIHEQPPAARSASSAGVSAASMRAIWRCRRRTWCDRRDAGKSVRQRRARDQRHAALRGAVGRNGRGQSGASRKAIAGDLPVPATSIYSRTDGIVNWRTCLLRPSDTAENIEVHLASHIGLGVNAGRFVGGRGPSGPGRGRIQAI